MWYNDRTASLKNRKRRQKMLFEKKEITLKNGEKAILRAPRREDGAEMCEYLRTMSSETEFVIRYPEECTETVESEGEFLEKLNSSDLNMMIVCEVDGKIAGNCQIMFHGRIKTAHRATLAIGLTREYWELGIGSAMFDEMEKAARQRGCLQIELEFVEGNARARGLYEKKGFRITGVLEDATRLKDGTLLNNYHMVKKL